MVSTQSSSTTSTQSSSTSTPFLAAQQFIQDSLTNPTLTQKFFAEIQTVNGQSNAPQQLTQWLSGQGYNTTPEAIYQAYWFAQNNELWFWNGVYGSTQVQYSNPISLNISSSGIITLSFDKQSPLTINNPVVTSGSSGNSITVTWSLSNNNTTSGNFNFPPDQYGCLGTIQLGEQSPAFSVFVASNSTISGNSGTLAGWQGNYSVELWGFAPVLAISPDSSSQMSVSLGGTPLKNCQFAQGNSSDYPGLTWSSQDGNSTSGNLTLVYYSPFAIDTSTNTANFVPQGTYWGNSFYGTLTFTLNGQSHTWNYYGQIGQPQSFPLSQFCGYYGATAIQSADGSLIQGDPLIIQPNGQGQIQVLLNGTEINGWQYDSAYNLLTWTTNNNISAGYLTFAPPSSSTSSTPVGPTFSGTLTQNGTTQPFSGSFSNPSGLSNWIGDYGTTFLIPSTTNSSNTTSSSTSSNSVKLGPELEVYMNSSNNTPQVVLNFGNGQFTNLPTSGAEYDQQTNTLTWTSSSPINTSGSVAFTQQTVPTAESSYVGNQFVGTLTLPQQIGNFSAQTYTFNGEIGQPNFNSNNPSSVPLSQSSPSSSSGSFWAKAKADVASFAWWRNVIISGFVGYAGLTIAETVCSVIGTAIKALVKLGVNAVTKLFTKTPEMTSDNAPDVSVEQINNDAPSTEKLSDTSPSEIQQDHQTAQETAAKETQTTDTELDTDTSSRSRTAPPPEENPMESESPEPINTSTIENQPVQSSDQSEIDNTDISQEQKTVDEETSSDDTDDDDSDDEPTERGMGDDIGDDMIDA